MVFNVDATLMTNVSQNRSFSGAEPTSTSKYGLGLNATAAKGGGYDDFVKELISGYANIYFDVNSSAITAESKTVPGIVEEYMRKNPGVNIEVLGYVDKTGVNDSNQKLSQHRAQAVVKVLSDAGIGSLRLNVSDKGVFTNISRPSLQTKALAKG